MSLSRRQFICSAVAVAGTATMPVPALAATSPAVPLPPKAVAWIIGTNGDYNWRAYWAPDIETAKGYWLDEECGDCECQSLGPDPETGEAIGPEVCDRCSHGEPDGERIEAFDKLDRDPTPGEWIDAGLGHTCDRCDYETAPQEGAQNVAGKAVCTDCMTLADWDIVDPERAAELREEAA